MRKASTWMRACQWMRACPWFSVFKTIDNRKNGNADKETFFFDLQLSRIDYRRPLSGCLTCFAVVDWGAITNKPCRRCFRSHVSKPRYDCSIFWTCEIKAESDVRFTPMRWAPATFAGLSSIGLYPSHAIFSLAAMAICSRTSMFARGRQSSSGKIVQSIGNRFQLSFAHVSPVSYPLCASPVHACHPLFVCVTPCAHA